MTHRGYYPPSHRRTDVPQPEICDVTGFVVPGQDLMVSEARGLTGQRVSSASRFLAHARTSTPELFEIVVPEVIGQGRVYEPGDESWFSQGPPGQEYFTPQALTTLRLWLRNDAIPRTSSAAAWQAPGGLGLPSAAQATASLRPTLIADPFDTDCPALRFGSGRRMTFTAAASAAATPLLFAAAFRTPAVLGAHAIVSAAAGSGALAIAANGSITFTNDAGVSSTVAAAATIAAATDYVLLVLRDGANALVARVNGTDVSAGATDAGALTVDTAGNAAGMDLDVAELALWSGTDYDGETATLRQLERYLGYLVGVDL